MHETYHEHLVNEQYFRAIVSLEVQLMKQAETIIVSFQTVYLTCLWLVIKCRRKRTFYVWQDTAKR